jgi:hypothetical protein
MKNKSILFLLFFSLVTFLLQINLRAQSYVLIGWNDLGMHCANKDFSKIAVLPPFNNIYAQLIKKTPGQIPEIITSGVIIEYNIPGNTYSVGKTNFWTYAQQLFNLPQPLPANIGLTGKGLTGTLDPQGNYYFARGIPVTPFQDNNLITESPYQLIHLVAIDQSSLQVLTTTDVVIPVSNEIGCVQSGCHSSEQNILNEHEGAILTTPVLCASCHADPALGTTGNGEAPIFSQAIHGKHAELNLPATTETCYKCHPGPNTQCLRDVMSQITNPTITCENCHGTLAMIAQSIENGREPWLQEPKCGDVLCHGSQYSEQPGKLFKESQDHGNLFCSACHSSPHAILPSREVNDNLQNLVLQGFEGTLQVCSVCHGDNPTSGGPHQATTMYFQVSVNVSDGWNMVSIPGFNPTNQNVNTWWAFRDLSSNVFKYLGGYQSVTTATPGTGYWMKHSGVRTYNTGDEWPAGGIQIVPHTPLTAASGWNLIGGYELIVSTANVSTVPVGLQSGPIYKYSGGYQVAATIDPGYGYWIKLTGAGQIIIPETLAKDSKPAEWFAEDWGRIIITDNAGHSCKLYVLSYNNDIDLSEYELPPAPPSGMFDIRFSSGRIAEDINNSMQTIEMNGVIYPITVRVEGMDMRLMDEIGNVVNLNLKSGEETVISDATIEKLLVSSEQIPTVYALEQNYPNPFNPSTVIEFSLPEDVANVKLSIYNALGEKVAELVNTSLVAGKYSYQWSAKNAATGMSARGRYASGVYIYELRTDKFVLVKKMILMK